MKEDFEKAAYPPEVLLYEDFDYKISFHTKEKEEWKKVMEEKLYLDETVQHRDVPVGQIDNFPRESCSNLKEIKMRLEPEPHGVEHQRAHPPKSLYDEGVTLQPYTCTKATPKRANSASKSLIPVARKGRTASKAASEKFSNNVKVKEEYLKFLDLG